MGILALAIIVVPLVEARRVLTAVLEIMFSALLEAVFVHVLLEPFGRGRGRIGRGIGLVSSAACPGDAVVFAAVVIPDERRSRS